MQRIHKPSSRVCETHPTSCSVQSAGRTFPKLQASDPGSRWSSSRERISYATLEKLAGSIHHAREPRNERSGGTPWYLFRGRRRRKSPVRVSRDRCSSRRAYARVRSRGSPCESVARLAKRCDARSRCEAKRGRGGRSQVAELDAERRPVSADTACHSSITASANPRSTLRARTPGVGDEREGKSIVEARTSSSSASARFVAGCPTANDSDGEIEANERRGEATLVQTFLASFGAGGQINVEVQRTHTTANINGGGTREEASGRERGTPGPF
ncbi:hypothetical protein BJY59DRAFT_685113 [Rhodotorula toruloides]